MLSKSRVESKIILKLFIFLFVFSSCSRDITISKRHYRPGYYVSIQSKQDKELEKEIAPQSKDSESSFISYVANKSEIIKNRKNEKRICKVSKDTVTEEMNFYRKPKDEKKAQEDYEEASVLCNKELMADSPYKLSKEIINDSINKLGDETPKEKGFKWLEILFWGMSSSGLILLAYGIITSLFPMIAIGGILLVLLLLLNEWLIKKAGKLYYKYWDLPLGYRQDEKISTHYRIKRDFYRNKEEFYTDVQKIGLLTAGLIGAIMLLYGIVNLIIPAIIIGSILFIALALFFDVISDSHRRADGWGFNSTGKFYQFMALGVLPFLLGLSWLLIGLLNSMLLFSIIGGALTLLAFLMIILLFLVLYT